MRMSAGSDTVYIKGDRNVEVTKREVKLGDLVSLECSDKSVAAKLKCLKILTVPEKGQHRFVVSILKIISLIHEKYPGLTVLNMGEADMIITYEDQKTPNAFFRGVKVAVVVMITFVGAAFSIMAFNNDVDTTKLFAQIYLLVTGNKTDGFTILELTYSIGLIIGILVFFNHFGKKRFSIDPTPMEVEMRLYENDIQTTLIEAASRKELELDVDKSNHSGTHRT